MLCFLSNKTHFHFLVIYDEDHEFYILRGLHFCLEKSELAFKTEAQEYQYKFQVFKVDDSWMVFFDRTHVSEDMKEYYGLNAFHQDKLKEMNLLQRVSEMYDFIIEKQHSKVEFGPVMRGLGIGSGSGSMVNWMPQQIYINRIVNII